MFVNSLEIVLKISGLGVKNQFLMIFDALANNIFPVPGVGYKILQP